MKTEGEACKGHRAVSNPMTTGTTHRPQLEVALAWDARKGQMRSGDCGVRTSSQPRTCMPGRSISHTCVAVAGADTLTWRDLNALLDLQRIMLWPAGVLEGRQIKRQINAGSFVALRYYLYSHYLRWAASWSGLWRKLEWSYVLVVVDRLVASCIIFGPEPLRRGEYS